MKGFRNDAKEEALGLKDANGMGSEDSSGCFGQHLVALKSIYSMRG